MKDSFLDGSGWRLYLCRMKPEKTQILHIKGAPVSGRITTLRDDLRRMEHQLADLQQRLDRGEDEGLYLDDLKATIEEQKEAIADTAKKIIQCRRNTTALRRLFAARKRRRHEGNRAAAVVEAYQDARRKTLDGIEDWMDGTQPTTLTSDEEMTEIMGKLNEIRNIVEDEPRLMARWCDIYADAALCIDGKEHGTDD